MVFEHFLGHVTLRLEHHQVAGVFGGVVLGGGGVSLDRVDSRVAEGHEGELLHAQCLPIPLLLLLKQRLTRLTRKVYLTRLTLRRMLRLFLPRRNRRLNRTNIPILHFQPPRVRVLSQLRLLDLLASDGIGSLLFY